MVRNVILNVNLDEKCKRCGQGGVVNKTGLCMKCITDDVLKGKFDRVILKAKKEVTDALHQK